MKIFLQKHKANLIYGFCLALLLILLKYFELRFILFDHSIEIYIGFIAILFTALGIWLALKLSKPKIKTVVIEKEVFIRDTIPFIQNSDRLAQFDLSKRELEILDLLAQGLSNQEIANHLFVSLSTIKTHIQHLYDKLDVKRRTQAIEKARRLQLIP